MRYDLLTKKKARLDSYQPLPQALVKNLEEWFRVELTYSSNAIEGNTLTRLETGLVIEKGLTVGGKSLIEHLEATNHAQAMDFVKTKIDTSTQALTENDVLVIHQHILRGIDDENAGRYRSVAVRIAGSMPVMPNPLKVSSLMKALFEWLSGTQSLHPVAIAAEAHYRLVSIHPFIDGNGRTARLLMNLILAQHGYPPALILPRDRLAYLSSLEKAQLGGSLDDYEKIIERAINRSFTIYFKALEAK